MRIADYLSPSLIKLHLRSRVKDDLFSELIEVLAQVGKITDRKAALLAIQAREAKMSTGVNRGLAIPHASLAGTTGLLIALGISDAGLDYQSPDGQPVHLVFLVLSQAGNPATNIQALAEICRLFSLPGLRDRVLQAKTAQEVLDLIRREE
jgi:mannitol/fructose-specific phosphotransferase system IIA component (Ntr-type)